MTARLLLVDPSPLRASRFALALRRVPGVTSVELAVLTRRIQDTMLEVRPWLVIVVSEGGHGPTSAPHDPTSAGHGAHVRYLAAHEVEAFLDPSSSGIGVAAAAQLGSDRTMDTRSGALTHGRSVARSVVTLLAEIESGVIALPKEKASGSSVPCSDTSTGPLTNSTASLETLNFPLVCIGASTGGLPVIESILRTYPSRCPPTLIVQHIRGSFTSSLAERLSRICNAYVTEAFEDAPIEPGLVYLAPGDATHLEVSSSTARGGAYPDMHCRLVGSDKVSGHRPSVDALFHSAARYGPRAIGVLLTGMGRDGAEGLLEIKRNGGRTLAQDAETSVVYGMPRVAAELGAVQHVLPAGEIGPAILRLSGVMSENKGCKRV